MKFPAARSSARPSPARSSRTRAFCWPTSRPGALDSKATDELLRVFSDISRSGQTILMVTHSVRAASRAGRVLFIKDGEVYHQLYRGNLTDDQLYQKITDALTVLQAGGEQA